VEVVIDGQKIQTALDFHLQIAKLLDFPTYYGRNVHALWDVLTSDVERPVLLIWKDSAKSRQALGEAFDHIVAVLERVQERDAPRPNPEQRFTFRLE